MGNSADIISRNVSQKIFSAAVCDVSNKLITNSIRSYNISGKHHSHKDRDNKERLLESIVIDDENSCYCPSSSSSPSTCSTSGFASRCESNSGTSTPIETEWRPYLSSQGNESDIKNLQTHMASLNVAYSQMDNISDSYSNDSNNNNTAEYDKQELRNKFRVALDTVLTKNSSCANSGRDHEEMDLNDCMVSRQVVTHGSKIFVIFPIKRTCYAIYEDGEESV